MRISTVRKGPQGRVLPTRGSVGALFLVLAPAIVAACAGAHHDGAQDGGAAEAEASSVASYAVRGRVVALPIDNGGEIRMTHEAIDDFATADGEIIGMDSMTMSFPLEPSVDGSALAVGDIVEFELRVDWGADEPATVTRIESLPDGTELAFGSASPPPDAE